MIIAILHLGTHIDINSINEANIYRQRRNRHKRIETNDGRRGEKDTRMEEKERVENQRNIFTVIPCEEGRENEKVEMFYGSGLRGKIKKNVARIRVGVDGGAPRSNVHLPTLAPRLFTRTETKQP